MSGPFDPYYIWLAIPPFEQPPDHYRLLGLSRFEANAEVIHIAAQRQTSHLQTFRTGEHAILARSLMGEVAAARACLLDAKKKAAYDAQLRGEPSGTEPHIRPTERLAETRPAAPPTPPTPTAPPTPPPSAPAQPSQETPFGEYVLLGRISKGGTGDLFKAKHKTMGRMVAIKVLSKELAKSPDRVARFHRKCQILAKLRHPNLVEAFDAGERDGKHYLIMEFIDGQTLWQVVKESGPLAPKDVIGYMKQAAARLGYAHSQGVCHRNLKPSNLMVDWNGNLKVIGLGLARSELDDANFDITQPGQAMGTVDYMAPEQAVDAHSADHRADIYGLGCVLCALLTGQPPYPVKNPTKKFLAHRQDPIPSLFELRPEVPLPLDTLFRKMLAKTPDQRPQSMAEVIAALETC